MARAAPARQRILDAAHDLVLQNGFTGTTVDAVLAGSAASKGAFFHHFPSKAHLARALVERYAAADSGALDTFMATAEAKTDDPAEQIVSFVRALEEASDALMEVQPSCLFISFIYESELADAGTDEIVAHSVRHWRERILEKLEGAAVDRPGLADYDLPALADQVFTTFEGAFLLARALDAPDSMRRQLAHLRRYLELLLGIAEPPPRRPRRPWRRPANRSG